MIGIDNDIITRVLICLFLFYFDPNCRVLCDEAIEPKSTTNFCDVPTLLPNANITYKCINQIKNESKNCVSNGIAIESTMVKITCDPGYSTNGEDALVTICYEKEWVPPIKGCIKKCKKLNPVNVHLECFRKNISIPCDEKFLVSGVTVRPTCNYLTLGFHSYYPGHQEIHCQEDGNWDNDLLSCVQDCGLLPSSNDSKTWGMPWDVVILRDMKKICFGTIISPRVILTSEFCMLFNIHNFDLESMMQNPLDPAVFKVGIMNDVNYHNNTVWMRSLKHNTSKLNFSEKDKNFTPLKIKEFRYFKNGKQDKSLLYDVLIVIMEEEVNFNSRVHPACVDWENRNRLNITTGIAKVQQYDPNPEEFSAKDHTFLSHDACQKNPTYPYTVFNWANIMYGFDEEDKDPNNFKIFNFDPKKRNQTALHKGKLFCLEVKQDESTLFVIVSGSGVMIEKDHRYFIRGIAGRRFIRAQKNNDTSFKYFLNYIHLIANFSYENFSKNIIRAVINGSVDVRFIDSAVHFFNYNFASLVQSHLKSGGAELLNGKEKLIDVTDIADYVDWLKHVVAEVDPYYKPIIH
ncbi:uncharacterized protein LOC135833214 isoform X2 [Planococcus citri]|uniref:uncharacterized protein LOC135833214 isoform X2 n=1 Tax=Planococcus citri TaxID=170843 RepID=UPI0031F850BD